MQNKIPWYVAQYGAREHYAIPRALLIDGILRRLYTDVWFSRNWQLLKILGGPFKHAVGRYHNEISSAIIQHWTCESLGRSCLERIPLHKVSPYQQFTDSGIWFSRKVARAITKESNRPGIFFSYDTSFLEAAHTAASKGWKTIVCQMDPARVEQRLNFEEEKRWPDWVAQAIHIPESYNVRRDEEWQLADRVVVNSSWSRNALVEQGVPISKISIVPLSFESTTRIPNTPKTFPSAFSKSQPMRVLFLGLVVLRKGIQYLCEAARLLIDEPIQFDIVGPVIGITEAAIKSAPPNVHFHGRASRADVHHWYQNAHLFVLPTLSDGFALTQLEAMANGLPVIATPNCASIVCHDYNGVIIPIRDVPTLASTLVAYNRNPQRLCDHSARAFETVEQYSMQQLQFNLAELARGL